MKYDTIRDQLKTGDLVLFSGEGLLSKIVKVATNSKWSHIGLIIYDEAFDMLTVWESTTLSNTKDMISNQFVRGVQITPLSNRLLNYKGEMAVRILRNRVTAPYQKKLAKLRRELRGRDYEHNKLDLLLAAYDGPFGFAKEDLSSVFCSELVAAAYMAMDLLLTGATSASEYTPADFSSSRNLALLDNKLGEEISLEY